MTERTTGGKNPNLSRETKSFFPILSEIDRPYHLDVDLYDRGPAVLVDQRFVLSYKRLTLDRREAPRDRFLVGRERTIIIKIEKTGHEFIYPPRNEQELRGVYGVVILDIHRDGPVFYVSEQYRVTNLGRAIKEGKFCTPVVISSTKSLEPEMIDSELNYSDYLRSLHTRRS